MVTMRTKLGPNKARKMAKTVVRKKRQGVQRKPMVMALYRKTLGDYKHTLPIGDTKFLSKSGCVGSEKNGKRDEVGFWGKR